MTGPGSLKIPGPLNFSPGPPGFFRAPELFFEDFCEYFLSKNCELFCQKLFLVKYLQKTIFRQIIFFVGRPNYFEIRLRFLFKWAGGGLKLGGLSPQSISEGAC